MLVSPSLHIVKTAFYFHTAGDHTFFCWKIKFTGNEKETVITHLKELLTILLCFWRQYKLHRSAELASRVALCLNTWANLQLVKLHWLQISLVDLYQLKNSTRNHVLVFTDIELDLKIFQYFLRSQNCWVNLNKSFNFTMPLSFFSLNWW